MYASDRSIHLRRAVDRIEMLFKNRNANTIRCIGRSTLLFVWGFVTSHDNRAVPAFFTSVLSHDVQG
jgi:hypothetical protein